MFESQWIINFKGCWWIQLGPNWKHLPHNFSRGTEESYEIPQSGYRVFWLRFEPDIYRIQAGNIAISTSIINSVNYKMCRAIAQAVSRWLPTAAARVRTHVRSCGTGTGFLRVLRFPLPILITPTATPSSSIIRGWYNRPVSGRRTKWTQSHPTPRN
jgi:hypothetical protein